MPIRNGFGITEPILEIPGIDIWFDPADENSITFNGTRVAQIKNKTGNPTTAAQAIAIEQPSTDTANGRTVIKFEGGLKLEGLDLDTISPLVLKLQYSFSMVLTQSTYQAYILSSDYQSSSPAVTSKFLDNEIDFFSAAGGIDRESFATVADSNLHIITLTFDEGANFVGYFDGAQAFDEAAVSTSNGATLKVLGHPYGFITGRYAGLIGDFIFSRRIWTSAEINKVETYLSNKWGIAI